MKTQVKSWTAVLMAAILMLILCLTGCKANDPGTDTNISTETEMESVSEDEAIVVEKEFAVELDENQSTGAL